MVNWKKLAMVAIPIILGLVLLWGQMLWSWLTFANVWSQRIYILLCFALVSFGHSMTRTSMSSKITHGLLLFVVLNVVMLAFGGWAAINDAVNGTLISEGSGVWVAYDVLTTPFTSKALEFKIIVQTLIGTLPAIVLMFSVGSVWQADSPDETQSSIMEFIIVLIMLVSFSFLGNLFGFAWV